MKVQNLSANLVPRIKERWHQRDSFTDIFF